MKFGGTSMGSPERMRIAARLVQETAAQRPVAVVVSAMTKVTDLMLQTLRHAELGDAAALEANLAALQQRHEDACLELLPEEGRGETFERLSRLLSDFVRIANGILMLGVRPPCSVDEAVAIGEQLSATMFAAYLRGQGTPAEAVNAASVIVTDGIFGNASPIMPLTRERSQSRLGALIEARVLPIVTGFNGATVDGRPTTLGRGGSDFSASILAAALDAAELWIWTDVDGIMSADPRLVRDAAVLEEVTYSEAAELAYNGAKVLHPRTLAPLVEKQIPVWNRNSFNPGAPGTRIVSRTDYSSGARAVTSMNNVALVALEPASAALNGTRIMARALDALVSANAEVLAVTSSSYRQSFCFLVRRDDLSAVRECLQSSLSLELLHGYLKPIDIDENVGLLAVVGEGMRGTPGLAGRIFTAISRHRVNIIAIAQGSSELTIGIVVRRDGLEKAVQAVHEECGMGQIPAGTAPVSTRNT